MLLTLTIRSISCYFGVKTLLQGLLNSNSHGNGHTDHGVVTSAQSEKVCIKGGMAKFSIGLTKEGYQITEYDLQPLEIAWHNGGKYVVTIQEEMSK